MTTGLFADFPGPKEIYGGQYPLADYKWLYTKKNGKVNFNVNSNVILAEVANSQKSYAKKNESTKFRDNLRDNGFIIGMYSDMAKYPEKITGKNADTTVTTYYESAWGYALKLSTNDPNAKTKVVTHEWSSLTAAEKAKRVLMGPAGDNKESIFAWPEDQLNSSEQQKSAKGGYCIWTQDIEADSTLPENSKEINQQFAGIIAALWAGRHHLGSDFKIIPVISKSVLTNLVNNTGDELVNLKTVHDMVEPILTDKEGNGLKYFEQGDVPPAGPHKRTSWSLLSYLKMNGIIDGFISEETRSQTLKPGGELSINSNAAPFHHKYDIPYALMGYWNGDGADMPNSPTLNNKIQIGFHGKMPLDSAMYFINDKSKDDFLALKPDQYFTPVPKHLFSVNASQYQHSTGGGHRAIDLTSLPSTNSVQISINTSREAEHQSYSGFYRIQDAAGTVKDPVTGQLIVPGESGYKKAALSSENIINNLSNISLNKDGANSYSIDINGGVMMAPFAVITEPGQENTFFSYAAANSDGISHFKQLSTNSFGMEDTQGGGDMDFNDLEISFRFLEIL